MIAVLEVEGTLPQVSYGGGGGGKVHSTFLAGWGRFTLNTEGTRGSCVHCVHLKGRWVTIDHFLCSKFWLRLQVSAFLESWLPRFKNGLSRTEDLNTKKFHSEKIMKNWHHMNIKQTVALPRPQNKFQALGLHDTVVSLQNYLKIKNLWRKCIFLAHQWLQQHLRQKVKHYIMAILFCMHVHRLLIIISHGFRLNSFFCFLLVETSW
jgi:hypothetical protein